MSRHQDNIDSRLSELGFEAAAAPDQAIAKLRELRGQPGVTDAAIAAALGRVSSPEAAQMLSEIETGATGVLRREVRRALFKLRERGFTPRPASVATRAVSEAAPAGLSAVISPIDPEGARIVWLIKERPQSGVTRLFGLASEAEGLVGATVANSSRRELRDDRADFERRAGAKLIDADWRLADFILCEAYRNTPEARRAKVGNFLTLRSELIASPPAADFVHPIYAELGVEQPPTPSLDLLKEPEIAQWQLASAQMRALADEVHELQESPLVLNRLQQEERIGAVVGRAIAVLASSAAIRRRLEDTAYYLARTGRKPAAQSAAAAAALMRDGADLASVPFFQALVRSRLGAAMAEQQERAREEPRLIVTPAEAMRSMQQRGPRR